jgi:hypothetical protein
MLCWSRNVIPTSHYFSGEQKQAYNAVEEPAREEDESPMASWAPSSCLFSSLPAPHQKNEASVEHQLHQPAGSWENPQSLLSGPVTVMDENDEDDADDEESEIQAASPWGKLSSLIAGPTTVLEDDEDNEEESRDVNSTWADYFGVVVADREQ